MKAPWLKNALVGVGSTPTWEAEGEMGALIEKVLAQSTEPALAFGQSVGVWAACRKAAMTPISAAENTETILPEQGNATAHNRLPLDHPAIKTMTQFFEKGNFRLIAEVFELMHQKELKLPTTLLPLALDIGKRSTELRLSLSKVLGARGIWLAQLNPSWKYAASTVESTTHENDIRLWEEGTLTQREAFFKTCRTHTPTQARELLAAQLCQLPAKERLQLIELMEINLSLDDESFLTPLLKDRSREVKDKVATLLAQLTESAYAKKIISYMQELVTKEKGLLKSNWKCAAPQEWNPEWEQMSFTKDAPSSYRVGGQRSWWLLQLARKTPLKWWNTYTDMTPKELLQWSKKTDWPQELQQGWIEALSCKDFDWIALILQQPPHSKMGNYYIQSKLQQVLPHLPSEQWGHLFALLPADTSKHWQTMGTLMGGLPFGQTLPKALSQNILKSFKENYNKKKLQDDYRFRYFFQDAANVLNPDILKTYQPMTSLKEQADESWLFEIEQVIELRQKLHQHFLA